jgi:multiple sugar transport system permease protein
MPTAERPAGATVAPAGQPARESDTHRNTSGGNASPGPDRRRRRGRPLSFRAQRAIAAWLLAAPFFVLFLVFFAGPVLASLVLGFTDLRSTDLRHPFAVNFVGFDNYTRLFQDETFRTAMINTAIFVPVTLALTMALALAVAVALHRGIERFRTLFRVGYYLPYVTSIVGVAVVWRIMYQSDSGVINRVLGFVGIDGPNWLESTTWSLPAIIIMTAWRGMGFQMVLMLAGLSAIPSGLYEAAEVDGASRWQRFRYVTVPMLRPTLLLGAVLGTIGLVQWFEEPYVMTRGGPLNSTLSVSMFTLNQFGFGNYSYAAAASYVIFAIMVVLTVVQFRLLRSNT